MEKRKHYGKKFVQIVFVLKKTIGEMTMEARKPDFEDKNVQTWIVLKKHLNDKKKPFNLLTIRVVHKHTYLDQFIQLSDKEIEILKKKLDEEAN